jgi:hypothetical protein
MRRTFQRLDQVPDIVVAEPGRKAQGPRMHNEWLSLLFAGPHQAQSEKMIYCCFEGNAGATKLLTQKLCDIVIER